MIALREKDAQTVSFTKAENQSIQYLVIHGSCLESVSINAFLHFVKNFYHKKFHLTLVGMNYQKMIQNSKDFFLVKDIPSQDDPLLKKHYYSSKTISSIPCLQICIDEEKSVFAEGYDQVKDKNWKYKELLKCLLKNDKANPHNEKEWEVSASPNIEDLSGEIPLLQYAFTKGKYVSAEYMLRRKYGAADPSYPCNTINRLARHSALSTAILNKDYKALRIMIKYNPESLRQKCVLVSKQKGKEIIWNLITPMHWVLKGLRMNKLKIQDSVVKVILRESPETDYDEQLDFADSDEEEKQEDKVEKPTKSMVKGTSYGKIRDSMKPKSHEELDEYLKQQLKCFIN